jgi:hypothetical protein
MSKETSPEIASLAAQLAPMSDGEMLLGLDNCIALEIRIGLRTQVVPLGDAIRKVAASALSQREEEQGE